MLDEAGLSDVERREIPVALGTSHAVFVQDGDSGRVSLRFFTSAGELPACGHGTVAALAVLAERSGRRDYQATLRAGGRTFAGWAVRRGAGIEAAFDPGTVSLREITVTEREVAVSALGIAGDEGAAGGCVASVGRARMLVPVASRPALAALDPGMARLRDACDRLGLLGCYVYCAPGDGGNAAARMFAPSIGVGEDIANANSTACLAAHLAAQGITVDMGDSLGTPSTITATARPGPTGPLIRVGGMATIDR